MATISITVPAAAVNRVLDAITALHGYTGFESDGTTPLTKAEFTRRYIITVIKNQVVQFEADQAAAAAKAITETKTNTEINIS